MMGSTDVFYLKLVSSSALWHHVMGKRSSSHILLATCFLEGVKFMLNLTDEWVKEIRFFHRNGPAESQSLFAKSICLPLFIAHLYCHFMCPRWYW